MSTRSTTTVFDTNGKPIVNLYRQIDGYFDSHGQDLADFLTDFKVTDGYSFGDTSKTANGMGCLAAQIIAHFKNGVGGFYIVPMGQTEEYNYQVRRSGSRVVLYGEGHGKNKTFDLYGDINTEADIIKLVTFVYDKSANVGNSGNERLKWRTIAVTADTDTYLEGYDTEDGDKFKRFLKSKIFGGKIVVLTKK